MSTEPRSEETLIEIWICIDVWGQQLYIREVRAVMNFKTSIAMSQAKRRKYSCLMNDYVLPGEYMAI